MKYEYRAYLWTLGALVLVFFGSLGTAAAFPAIIGKIEAFGLGTITGGLIGLLRMPRQSHQSQNGGNTLDLTGSEQEQ
jgi:uncharacterized membrane protein YeiH